MASALGHCPVRGNGWFWSEKTPNGLIDSPETIVKKLTECEARYCNFMLNCMPNRNGLLDTIYIDLLKEIGEMWTPNTKRPPLPQQGEIVKWEAPIANATATSGIASNLIDAIQLGVVHTDWISDNNREQSIILDLGKCYENIDILSFTQLHRCKPTPECSLTDGNIISAKLYASVDGKNYTQVSEGNWEADAKMRTMTFDDTKLQYLKLEISDFNGEYAAITEMQVGNTCDKLK